MRTFQFGSVVTVLTLAIISAVSAVRAHQNFQELVAVRKLPPKEGQQLQETLQEIRTRLVELDEQLIAREKADAQTTKLLEEQQLAESKALQDLAESTQGLIKILKDTVATPVEPKNRSTGQLILPP